MAKDTRQVQGLRVVVTGGTRGLGLALVRGLAARGASVGFVARRRPLVEALEREIGGVGVAGDVARKEDIYPVALQLSGRLGGVDVLINNASSLGPTPLKLLADTECEELEEALAANLLGPFRLTKALLGSLSASAREGRGGLVINISSDAAVGAYPTWGAYGASKAALLHLSRVWDEELKGQGVRVLSVDPGDMDTELHELAVPGADRAALRRPEDPAREIIEQIAAALGGRS